MILAVVLLIAFFFFLKLIIFIACSLEKSQNVFIQFSPHTSCLFSMLLKEHIVDIEKPDGLCSLTFVVDELPRIIFTPVSLFYYTLKIYKNNKWCFIKFVTLIKS